MQCTTKSTFTLICSRALFMLIGLLLLSSVQAANNFPKGVLWKIEYPGISSSYLFGTMHVDDPRVTNLPSAVDRALRESKSLTLETNPDPANMLSVAQKMIYQNGKKLETVIGKELFTRTSRELANYGFPPQMVQQLKPWAAAVTLSVPKPKTGIVLDHAIYIESNKQGKTFYAIETIDEQLSIFTRLSERDQVELLKETVLELHLREKIFEAMTQAYLNRDLDKLLALSKENMPSNPKLADKLNKSLVTDRNLRMYKRIQSQLKQGKAFIGVGTLHLPGEKGLLQLLVNHGYRVTAVY